MKQSLVAAVGALMFTMAAPGSADAQARARPRSGRVVVAQPVYVGGAFYYRGFFDPWWPYGYPGALWGPGYWGPGAYGWGRAVGSLRIQVRPRHAEVYVDGYLAGLVDDFDGVFQRLDVRPGEHEIQIYLEGYRTFRERLYVLPGRGHKIEATLEKLGENERPEPRPEPLPPSPAAAPGGPRRPIPPPPDQRYPPVPRDTREFGRISLRVQPEDAAVFIDGQGWQVPPEQDRLLVHLPPGPHRVEVSKPGFESYSTVVEVEPGRTESLNVSLSLGLDAR